MPEIETPNPDTPNTGTQNTEPPNQDGPQAVRSPEAQSRADGLRRRSGASPSRGLLPDALEELNATVEELRVAEEEMRAQNEELMQTRLRVEAERHRYQDLFEFAPEGYIITDRDGRVLEANRAAAEMLGIAPRFLKGRGLGTSVAPEDLPAYSAALRDADSQPQELAVRLRRRHVGLFRAAITVAHVAALGDRPTTLRWLVRDVSARHEAETARQADADRERRTAEDLRRLLLPALPAAAFAGLAVEAFMQAWEDGAEVGGGFFDAFALGEGAVALAAGVALGGGLAAAALSAEFRYALRLLLRESGRPAPVLARLHEAACAAQRLDDAGGDRNVAVTLAVLDTRTGETLLASAGGEPALLVRADGAVETFADVNPPLGVQPGLLYAETPVTLNAGDTLLLTAGLAGTPGLAETAAARHDAPLGVTAQAVLDAVRAESGGALGSEVCLLLARREG